MKNLSLLTACLFTGISAFAVAPSDEVNQMSRVLINNADIAAKLKEKMTDHLSDVKITQLKNGIFQYDLVFIRMCECTPLTAKVHIVEDLTPTFVDGPISYTSAVSFEAGK